MNVAKVQSFTKFARRIVKPGSDHDKNNGIHPLMKVDPSKVVELLKNAKGPGQIWAVIAVLLRIRFGDFVFGGRKDSKLIKERENALDDIEMTVMAFRKFVLEKYAKSIGDLSSLYLEESPNSRTFREEVKSYFQDVGFDLGTISRYLAFLRNVQDEIPTKIGEKVDPSSITKMMEEILYSAFNTEDEGGSFLAVSGSLCKIHNGKTGSEVYLSESALKLDFQECALVLGYRDHGGKLSFGAIVTVERHDTIAIEYLNRFPKPKAAAIQTSQTKEVSVVKSSVPPTPPPVSINSIDAELEAYEGFVQSLVVRLKSEASAKTSYEERLSLIQKQIADLQEEEKATKVKIAAHQATIDKIETSLSPKTQQ